MSRFSADDDDVPLLDKVFDKYYEDARATPSATECTTRPIVVIITSFCLDLGVNSSYSFSSFCNLY